MDLRDAVSEGHVQGPDKSFSSSSSWFPTLSPRIMEVENDPKWKGNKYLRDPFSTSMIMGERVIIFQISVGDPRFVVGRLIEFLICVGTVYFVSGSS